MMGDRTGVLPSAYRMFSFNNLQITLSVNRRVQTVQLSQVFVKRAGGGIHSVIYHSKKNGGHLAGLRQLAGPVALLFQLAYHVVQGLRQEDALHHASTSRPLTTRCHLGSRPARPDP